MNNKGIGTAFEHEFCERLKKLGFWVHFMAPKAHSGAQPCDVIACKNGEVYLFDCKTCADKTFRIGRLEDNQIFAFDRFIKTGNKNAYVAVKHDNAVYYIPYATLKEAGSVTIKDFIRQWNCT